MPKAETIFAKELNQIHDKDIKNFVIECFDKLCPDYFWTCPCSTTGKYHPQVSLGVGGLVRHTKLAVWWGIELLRAWPNIPKEANDEVIAALILHDLFKYDCGFNTSNHGVGLWQKLVVEYGTENPREHRIMVAIRDHMGKWAAGFTKDSKDIADNILVGHIVCITTHLADYCASRKVDEIYHKLQGEQYDPIESPAKETNQSPPCPGVRETESRQTTAAENGQ